MLVVVMNLLEALRDQVRLYLRGQQSLLGLREWLERHDDEVAASGDESLREFDAAVWTMLSEGDLGTLTEHQVRSGLQGELPGEPSDPVVETVDGRATVLDPHDRGVAAVRAH